MNPYVITGPALISFSGGRTSAYMLWRIVQAHGGTLPADIHVVFANTGKEREETLRFVHDCGTRWNVPIVWLERPAGGGFAQVAYNTASRNGEPFQAIINEKQRLPNWMERWCTSFLKVQPMTDFAASLRLSPGGYAEVIGLRYDEGIRILKGLESAEKRGRRVLYPLSKAKVTKADVMAFWSAQPFDLGLEPWEGNCDLCFLKGRGIKKRIIREGKVDPAWWVANETSGAFFDRRDAVAELIEEVYRTPDLFDPVDVEEYDVECGLNCAGEAA